MKKFVKVLVTIIIFLIVIAGIFTLFVRFRTMPTYAVQTVDLHINSTPERIDKGRKLASMLCFTCHYNSTSNKFTGRELTEAPQFGKIYSANITHDTAAGIGKLTDGQLVYFIRTGIKPDGVYVPPYMPKLIHIADEDLYSIIAYLRSDDKYLQANANPAPKSQQSFLTKFLVTIKAFKPFEFPKQPIPLPDTTNEVGWGKYIALYQYECYSCHSEDFSKNNYEDPSRSEGYFGGGNKMYQLDGSEINTLNITMDKETGIGKWSEEDFVKAVKTGVVPVGQPELHYPMQPYANLSDNEVKAIFAFLKTVPELQNKVDRKFHK